jgi:hypothetical protein
VLQSLIYQILIAAVELLLVIILTNKTFPNSLQNSGDSNWCLLLQPFILSDPLRLELVYLVGTFQTGLLSSKRVQHKNKENEGEK